MSIRSLSATALQDFLDCRRRFQLKYIDQISWPQPLNSANIKHAESIARGRAFHQLMQQHFLGIPDENLLNSIEDTTLNTWFVNTLNANICKIDASEIHTEYRLSTYISDVLVTGIIDLVVIHPDGSMKVIDWKTGTTKPNTKYFTARIQTRLYPFLLTLSNLFNATGMNESSYEKIEFIYWFPNFPHSPIIHQYSSDKLARDRDYLTALSNTIQTTPEDEMTMTNNRNTCQNCHFQVYCDRSSVDSVLDNYDLDEIEFDPANYN